ncbi:MAG: hypothetical protein ABI345_14950 [Jatrophihabitans sp.]
MALITTSDLAQSAVTDRRRPATRWAPLTGIAFVVFFLGSVVASSPPSDKASDAAWVANYTGHAHVTEHLVTGVLLILAALSLLSFLSTTWTRIAGNRQVGAISPIPLVAAGVASACIAVGGVLMGAIAATVQGTGHALDPALLRFCNDVGFAMVGLPGMLATALSVAILSVQGRHTGLFGRKMMIFGLIVAVILLASLAFIPIVALLVWLVVTAVVLIRRPAVAAQSPTL